LSQHVASHVKSYQHHIKMQLYETIEHQPSLKQHVR